MSGPKSSRYTVTERQRQLLAKQREEELRRKAEEKRKEEELRRKAEELQQKKSIIEETKGIATSIRSLFHEMKEVEEKEKAKWTYSKSDNGWRDTFSQLQDIYNHTNNRMASLSVANELSVIVEQKNVAQQCLAKASSIRNILMAICLKNDDSFKEKTTSTIAAGFQSKGSFVITEGKKDNEVIKIVQKNQKRLSLLGQQDLSLELQEQIEKANKLLLDCSPTLLGDFEAIYVIPLEKQCSQYIQQQSAIRAKYDEIYPLYLALCEENRCEVRHFTATKVSMEHLEEEIEKLKAKLAVNQEEMYISACIDEAMDEMGYQVFGQRDVCKKNGKLIHSNLYRYTDGTAINVSISSTGQIAMELGATDNCDRAPTITECDDLCHHMEQFCDDFSEIEKILLQKGVVMAERIALLPPSAEYAQIINVNDYQKIDTEIVARGKNKHRERNKVTRAE